jgi:hypothetical protein
MLKATVNGLKSLRRPEEVAKTRGLTVSQVLPVGRQAPAEGASPAAEQAAVPTAPESDTT